MTRVEALTALIERVENISLHEQPHGGMPMATACYLFFEGGFKTRQWSDAACLSAYHGSLDAVARLEAPLRERGHAGPFITPELGGGIHVGWGEPFALDADHFEAIATTEARARLLAVLKAMVHEATQPKETTR